MATYSDSAKSSYEEVHPELQSGEVFYCNIYPEKFDSESYQTKRMGEKAYDSSDRVVDSARPLFVSIKEFIEFKVILTDDGWQRTRRSETESEIIRQGLARMGRI